MHSHDDHDDYDFHFDDHNHRDDFHCDEYDNDDRDDFDCSDCDVANEIDYHRDYDYDIADYHDYIILDSGVHFQTCSSRTTNYAHKASFASYYFFQQKETTLPQHHVSTHIMIPSSIKSVSHQHHISIKSASHIDMHEQLLEQILKLFVTHEAQIKYLTSFLPLCGMILQ